MFYQKIILGMIQGVAEWLPVSSEGLIFLTSNNLFRIQLSYQDLIQLALFLHLGTFLAAFVYFRRDIIRLVGKAINLKKAHANDKKTLFFLITATLISGLLGFVFLELIRDLDSQFALTGKILNLITGLFLIVTGVLQLKAGKKEGLKKIKDLGLKAGIVLGLVQGLATLPGLSRSGLTVSALLLLGFQKALSLKLSFLLSLPIVLIGNVLLNLNSVSLSLGNILALLASFIFGLLTIHLLLKVARRLNFGLLVIFFGLMTIISAFL